MENAVWKNETLIASEIAKDYKKEKDVRKASGRKELLCPDPECRNKILKYCHGEIKSPYFAHVNNDFCDYAVFDSHNTNIMKTVRSTLYEHFLTLGYKIKPEVKILPHHYTHLLIELNSNSKIAIEIATQNISANKIDQLTEEYKKAGIPVKWIVIGDTNHPIKENHTFFIKRYALNESANKDLIVVDSDGKTATQYKADVSEYLYKGREVRSINYPDTYCEVKPISDLRIEIEELTFSGFYERYKLWHAKKTNAFHNKINKLQQQKNADNIELVRGQNDVLQKNVLRTANATEKINKIKIKIHEETGKYIGSKVNGTYEQFTINELTQKKPTKDCSAKEYLKYDFEKKAQEIKLGDSASVKILFSKMCFMTPKEETIFLNVYKELNKTDQKTARALKYIYERAKS